MELPKKSRIQRAKDGDGFYWIVPAEAGPKRNESTQIDVWWGRDPAKKVITIDKEGDTHHRITTRQERLLIRQQNLDGSTADLLMLSPGQVYDLIDALCCAAENP